MASSKGGLVAERVKVLEKHSVMLCSLPPPTTINVQIPLNSINSGQKRPLRPAPAAPHQHRTGLASARSSTANAESSVPLIATRDYAAASNLVGGIRVLPTHSDTPNPKCYVRIPQNQPVAECVDGLEQTVYTPPREKESQSRCIVLRDNFNALVSRIQSLSPLTSIQKNFTTITIRFENAIPAKRNEFKLGLLMVCLVLLITLILFLNFQAKDDSLSRVELDEYFHNLNYSRDELLVYKGESLEATPVKGILSENRCNIIERRKKSLSNGKYEIGVVVSNEHRTFPGSLLLANQRLVDNSPDMLAVDRAPLTYTVNLPGLTDEGSFTIVPSFSDFQSSVNKVLNTWFDKYQNDHSTVANFQSTESFAYSKELLRVRFGLDFINSVIESNIDFSAVGKGEKSIKIYKFTQVFYTVSVEPTKNPSDLFDSSVTLREIMRKTDQRNPPVLVDSVSYGRNIYVKIETTSIEKQVELNLSILKSKNFVHNVKDLKDLHIQIYVIGGHTNHTNLINVTEMNDIHDVITKYSTFTKYNQGFPISFSSQFIDDNTKAIVHLSTDYVESIRHNTCHKAIVKLIQKIWFVKWEVTWTEISFDVNGNKVTNKREWDKNLKVMKFPFQSEDIEIPGFVEDLKVVAKAHTILDSWRTIINRSDIPIIPRREFYVLGYSSSEIRPPIPE